MLFSIPISTFSEIFVLLNDISFIIRHFFLYIYSIFVVYLLYHFRLIRLFGDIELNPGPQPSSFKCFTICHWNLNSITSHDILKVKLLTAYNVIHKFVSLNQIVFLNHILTKTLRQTMTILIYLVIICPMLIILLEISVGEFRYIIRSLYLLEC